VSATSAISLTLLSGVKRKKISLTTWTFLKIWI